LAIAKRISGVGLVTVSLLTSMSMTGNLKAGTQIHAETPQIAQILTTNVKPRYLLSKICDLRCAFSLLGGGGEPGFAMMVSKIVDLGDFATD
jgi:hypothetical protein